VSFYKLLGFPGLYTLILPAGGALPAKTQKKGASVKPIEEMHPNFPLFTSVFVSVVKPEKKLLQEV